ncbi:MAG: hypothetical protein Tsb002_11370 [Wenzhouxiangellaceae bacterium]
MSLYAGLKYLHITAVVISGSLFVLRALLHLAGYAWRRHALLRWLPHANDSVLLLAAVALSVMTQQYPLTHAWLTAKILVLVFYILAGRQALLPGQPRRWTLFWFCVAAACFAYIVGAALAHHPYSWWR